MKILVIGESCKDVFVYGDCNRLTPEAPVPVFNPVSTTENGGMAKNVQKNVLALGFECNLLTNENWQSITKSRYIERRANHMFIRVDSNDKSYGRINIENIDLSPYDAIIISDYNKGYLREEDIRAISLKHSNTFLDTKKVLGPWCHDITYIKINNFEYEKTKHKLDETIRGKLIVTLGSDGALHNNVTYPVKKVEIKDVSGAGDTFVAGLATKYTETKNISKSIEFANDCATIVVQKKGVSTYKAEEKKMKYEEDREIKGLIHFKPEIFYDIRGEYINTFNVTDYGFIGKFVEDDFSISRNNVLRGMHGDSETKKLIQCLHGSILLGVADLRKDSPSYLQSRLYLLDDKNRHQVLVPEGCINGHYVLTDTCIFSYKQTKLYTGAKNQISVRYNDPWLKINWGIKDPILSNRDSNAKFLKDMDEECRKL